MSQQSVHFFHSLTSDSNVTERERKMLSEDFQLFKWTAITAATYCFQAQPESNKVNIRSQLALYQTRRVVGCGQNKITSCGVLIN